MTCRISILLNVRFIQHAIVSWEKLVLWMKLCGLTCKSPSVCQFYSMLWLLYVCLNFKYLNWTRAGTRCSDIFFVFAKSESVRAFICGMAWIDFAHIRMLQSYNVIKKALLSENCVLQGIVSLVKLSKEFKELDMYLAVPGLIENCSFGKIKKFVFSRCGQTIWHVIDTVHGYTFITRCLYIGV